MTSEHRLSVAPMCITVTKNILNNLVTEIRNNSDENNLLHEIDDVRENIGEVNMIQEFIRKSNTLYY